MPRVAIKTGVLGPDGREVELAEYLCDWPDCPNVATQVLVVKGYLLRGRRMTMAPRSFHDGPISRCAANPPKPI